MWNVVLLSLLFFSLPFSTAAAATNKNSDASSTVRMAPRLPPKISAASPRLVTPSPNSIRPFNQPRAYYSLGGGQRVRPVPFSGISQSPAPLAGLQLGSRRLLYGRSEYSSSRSTLEPRRPDIKRKLGFSAKAYRPASHRR